MMTSKIKFINAVSGGTHLDIWLDNAPFLSDFAPKALTSYLKVAPGTHIIQIHSINATTKSVPLLDYEVEFLKDQQYTLILLGSAKDPTSVHLSIYTDLGKCPGHRKASIRIIDASYDIKSIDLYDNNVKILSNINYDSVSEYTVIDTKKPTNFALTASGSLNVLLGPVTLKLDSNCNYTLVLFGNVTDATNSLTILTTKDCYNALCLHL
jgi:hypothetical protein